MRAIVRWTVVLIVAVLGIGLAVLNSTTVELNYYYGTLNVALPWLVGGSVVIGMLFGLIVNATMMLRLKRQVAAARREADRLAGGNRASHRLVPLRGH